MGRDTCVVMPTGGGKSLCYQFAGGDAAGGQTVIVVSPLIALMQGPSGTTHAKWEIASAFAEQFSRGGPAGSSHTQRRAAGEYRLLYLSPERLAAGGYA